MDRNGCLAIYSIEKIELPSFDDMQAHTLEGCTDSKKETLYVKDNEIWEKKTVRCRTIGDMTCTGVSESESSSLEEIISEVAATRVTERGGRADDKRSEAAMEDRKKEGYF